MCLGDQDLVDYMASSLQLDYELVDNWESVPSSLCLVRVIISNTGQRDIEPIDQDWQIFFDHGRLVDGTAHNPDGVELEEFGLLVHHINGDLHKLTPTGDFPGWPADETTVIEFFAQSYQLSKTDVFPNWYVTEEEALPRVFQSTADETLSFVDDFIHERQYKRSADELNEPRTPETRFEINSHTEDIGTAGKRLIPTPVSQSWEEDGPTVDITTGDWVIVLHDEELTDEAEFLSGKFLLSNDCLSLLYPYHNTARHACYFYG